MPIYEYYCDQCGCVEAVLRPVSECSSGYGCFNCGASMIRIYSAPAVLNRSKPRGFKFEPQKMNAWDDRIAHLRDVEEKKGSVGLREAKRNLGNLFNQTLRSKKDRYA